MADNQRIDDLRRRVLKDPASIAFAQLAEELRRAGHYEESVDICRSGLIIHPGYLSARVTLGRALIELNDLDTALAELSTVLKSAPENLAAIRGIAEIHHRRGELPAALAQYRAALALARNDPDLQQTVDELARQVEPPPPPSHADGLSFEQMQSEFLRLAPPPPKPAEPAVAPAAQHADGVVATPPALEPAPPVLEEAVVQPAPTEPEQPTVEPVPAPLEKAAEEIAPTAFGGAEPAPMVEAPIVDRIEPAPVEVSSASTAMAAAEDATVSTPPSGAGGDSDSAGATVAALERWLDAIHVARAERGA